jgi:hypothetical protein
LIKRDTSTDIPVLKIIDIRLLSLSYRITSPSLPLDIPTTTNVEGHINLRAYKVAKKSFKVIMSHELRLKGVVCRTRHQARFASSKPISPELFQNESFHHQIVNKLMPFNSELFAMLTSKSFNTPIITLSKVELKKDTSS